MPKNYVSNKDETIRLFENDFLETLSRVHWTVPLWVFVPIILFLLFCSFYIYYLPISNSLLLVLAGLFGWTFPEKESSVGEMVE